MYQLVFWSSVSLKLLLAVWFLIVLKYNSQLQYIYEFFGINGKHFCFVGCMTLLILDYPDNLLFVSVVLFLVLFFSF